MFVLLGPSVWHPSLWAILAEMNVIPLQSCLTRLWQCGRVDPRFLQGVETGEAGPTFAHSHLEMTRSMDKRQQDDVPERERSAGQCMTGRIEKFISHLSVTSGLPFVTWDFVVESNKHRLMADTDPLGAHFKLIVFKLSQLHFLPSVRLVSMSMFQLTSEVSTMLRRPDIWVQFASPVVWLRANRPAIPGDTVSTTPSPADLNLRSANPNR